MNYRSSIEGNSMIQKILIKRSAESRSEPRVYNIEHIDKDYHSSDGMFIKDDLKKSGTLIKSNTGREFIIVDASFIDSFKQIRKSAQTIPKKIWDSSSLKRASIRKASLLIRAQDLVQAHVSSRAT